MTLAIGMTAILVGIFAYGIGKLSVYLQQEAERDPRLPADPTTAWDARQFEVWSKAQENEVVAERELAKIISTLSLASIAGVATLGQLKVIGTPGVIFLILGFLLPTFLGIANLHMRQSLFNERARRLREAFELGETARCLPNESLKDRLVAALTKLGAIFFGVAVLLISLALPATQAHCSGRGTQSILDQLYCSDLIQTLARKD